jgi:hypothetical protein
MIARRLPMALGTESLTMGEDDVRAGTRKAFLRAPRIQARAQRQPSVRPPRNHRPMLQVLVVCSDCAEESEVLVEELDELEREVCACGYSCVVLSASEFEPVYAKRGELIELPQRSRLTHAA